MGFQVYKRIGIAAWILCTIVTRQALGTAPDLGWAQHGLDHSETRFSEIDQVDTKTVRRLGLAWYKDLPRAKSLEATPLLIDGVMYFTTNDSVVFAVDGRTGSTLWSYDPEVWKVAGKRYRQVFHVNRGVAHWDGKIYVGTFDGRLIALNAKTGKQVWSVQTLEQGRVGYITGAPRTFNGKVIIGQGGTEAGYARGYVTAYDAQSGDQVWRFYVVPGNPDDGFENPAMEMAAKTWTGEWWNHGGGGSPWNALTFDPELNRVYIGTGNGSPWNHKVRSPGGGDNLFLCSIVAVDADTGEYQWHYQTNPGETWDYTSTQDIVLADMDLDGKRRQVILHAPKNGFFYVIDRVTGKLLSAEKLGTVTWAERIDLASGRPVETAGARFPEGDGLIYPSGAGLHNWHSMSFNPNTGLAYLPKLEMPMYFSEKTVDHQNWRARKYFFNTGFDLLEMEGLGDLALEGSLLAWNPQTQSRAWEVPLPGIWNGGTLSTAGNLVFQGNAGGEFAAYHAETGEKLWSTDVGLGVVAAPMTYRLDGTQYIALLVGWGGSIPSMFGLGVNEYGWQYGKQVRRLLVYVLDGNAELELAGKSPVPTPLDPPEFVIDQSVVKQGSELFNSTCQACHGYSVVAGGMAPDLRASYIAANMDSFDKVVREGALEARGMPKYADLNDAEVKQLYHYIRHRARIDLKKRSTAPQQ